ncbi:MAG: HipA domain-containing protein [Lachnospiraceae bacterium]|nr:HipA domain-containing protein [Lachnospiraceae bacterium]
MIDFTTCRIIPGRAYNGANGNKIAVEYEGSVYMLKFPPPANKKNTELSYSNGCISEHIASSLFNLLGIPAQETILGTYTVRETEKTVCACKDFTDQTTHLFDFCSIKNTVLDSDSNGSGTELADVLDTIANQKYVSPALLRDFFWDMFIVDALLGNFDRHNGNWGFLYDDIKKEARIAPVYDCGSCLLPQADDTTIRKVLDITAELHARVYQFPTSAIKINGRKINYYDFINSGNHPDCAAALKRVFPRIDLRKTDDFIDRVPVISSLQKEFYKKYIHARYSLLLAPAAKSIISSVSMSPADTGSRGSE